jgi:FixJ family two-component response regulator
MFNPSCAMTECDHQVVVLDDDPSILKGIRRLLNAQGLSVRLHSTPDEFFTAGIPSVPSCLLLDNKLGGGMSGLQVHEEVIRRGWFIPTVFLTAHWNVQSVVKAMRAGADGFLTKPFDPAELIEVVHGALERSRARHQVRDTAVDAKSKAATLTEREREVVRLVVGGLLNKEIAAKLGLALVTVKVHRGRAMRKLGAGNAAELARIASQAGMIH